MFRHEASAVGQAEQTTFAAHCLRDQEGFCLRVIEAGRMELNELHIGNLATSTVGHGNAVSG